VKKPYRTPQLTPHPGMFTTPHSENLGVTLIIMLSLDRARLQLALREMLALWDRREDSGWTAADVQRLAEIRKLVNGG
jgi:hypothetical protein